MGIAIGAAAGGAAGLAGIIALIGMIIFGIWKYNSVSVPAEQALDVFANFGNGATDNPLFAGQTNLQSNSQINIIIPDFR